MRLSSVGVAISEEDFERVQSELDDLQITSSLEYSALDFDCYSALGDGAVMTTDKPFGGSGTLPISSSLILRLVLISVVR